MWPLLLDHYKSFFVSISLDTPVPANKDYPGFIPLYGYEPKWVGFSNVVMTTSIDPKSPLDRDFHSYLTYDKNSIVSKNPSGRRFLTTFLFYDTAFSQSQYVDVEENLMFNNSVFAMSTNKVPFVYKESFNLCKNTPLNYCK
ncbi:MAG: hypothetical protein IE909_17145 [Campylobacterales bacterium]|nr:hypothetical protein [Campylobacterales bacterium]